MPHTAGSVDTMPFLSTFRNIWSKRMWAKPRPRKPCPLKGGCSAVLSGISVIWEVSDGVTGCWVGVRIRTVSLLFPPCTPGTTKGVEWSLKKSALTSAYISVRINVMKQGKLWPYCYLLTQYCSQTRRQHPRAREIISCGPYSKPAHSSSEKQILMSSVPDFREGCALSSKSSLSAKPVGISKFHCIFLK